MKKIGNRVLNFMDMVEKNLGVVEEEFTIKLDSRTGINYSSRVVLDSLRRREENRVAKMRVTPRVMSSN